MKITSMPLIILHLGLLVFLTGCASVSTNMPKNASMALPSTPETEFGRLAAGWSDIHKGKSGFYPLVNGMDALGSRLDMIDTAQQSIDLQYFLMKDDSAGVVMASALWRAADRGVRVRFLLDDIFTTAPDHRLLILNAHPNIEVRLFNPVSRRGLKSLNFIGHFRRANRRMHNKSLTVDNSIAIVGGRNIANEYFQLAHDGIFADFDILAFGPIAEQISDSFDQYWNHALAIPLEQLTSDENVGTKSDQAPSTVAEQTDNHDQIYQQALNSDLVQRLISGKQPLFEADAYIIADDPSKLVNEIDLEHMQLATELGTLLSSAERELIFITPYYVPKKEGIEFIRSIIDRGVKVTIVTNSLASTNHIPVHSAYAGYRRKALSAGVELREVRAYLETETPAGQTLEKLTLHTKLIVIDQRYLFIGSLNLDPRSIQINAEMGLLIDSTTLAEQIVSGLNDALPSATYRVQQDDFGRLEWHTVDQDTVTISRTEPLSSSWRRFKAWFLRIVPDSQL